jgi:anti-sigma factor RsiW
MSHSGELLSAYLDGELTGSEESAVVAHLEECAGCRMELADLHTARAMVRALPILDVPGWVIGEVADTDGRVIPLRRRPTAWAAAAVAILVLFVSIATVLTPQPSLELDFVDIANTHRVSASQDGLPTGARVVLIAPTAPGVAE